MKRVIGLMGCFVMAACGSAVAAEAPYQPSPENLKAREDFRKAGLGIFIHWGLYAIPGQGEWYLNNGELKADEYARLANVFNPVLFDARAWAKTFKRAGAGYVCLTTRHHDGFSLFDTKASDYNVMKTPYGRDIVRELGEACRAEGLRFHLYYSLLDWTREDYPWKGAKTGAKTGRDPARQDYASYLAFMKTQLTELLTNYGPVGCIWFDGDWDRKGADWKYDEIYALIHRLQPACLVANNHHHAALPGEDVQCFERDIPGENKAGFSKGQTVERALPLETCMTLKNSFNWGYDMGEGNGWMYPTHVRQNICNAAAKGANILYNVGPRPDGTLPEEAVKRLEIAGAFLEKYGEAIRGTSAGGVTDSEGRFVTTRRGQTVYYLFTKPGTYRNARLAVPGEIESVVELATEKALEWKEDGAGAIRIDTPFTVGAPDFVCCLRVTLKGGARAEALFNGRDLTGWYPALEKRRKGEDPNRVFTVKDGILRVSGEETGGITSERSFRDYRLIVEYRWTGKGVGSRKGKAADSGVLYHSQGEDFAWYGTWMRSFECNILRGRTGDFILVSTKDSPIRYAAEIAGKTYVNEGNVSNTFRRKDWKNVEETPDVPPELPFGEWNTLEIVCRGSTAEHWLNGVKVLEARNLTPCEGRLQIQSEGHPIEFRRIDLIPLD